jgi:hypothetical protein
VLSGFFKQKRPPVWITAVVGVGTVGVLAWWHAAPILIGVMAALFLADVMGDTIAKVWQMRRGGGV